jgi:uncharacterized protein with HEPN domain
MRGDQERLLDIQDAIARIEKYAARGREAFEQDELIQSWMVRHLQIIGEAARTLSDVFRQQHSDWPWPQIIGMRNILVHNYFEIDAAIVWTVVEAHLPDLKGKVAAALQQQPTTLPPDASSKP